MNSGVLMYLVSTLQSQHRFFFFSAAMHALLAYLHEHRQHSAAMVKGLLGCLRRCGVIRSGFGISVGACRK